MSAATVHLDWHLNVQCPYCLKSFDLVDYDDDGRCAKVIFNNQWDKLKGENLICPHCGRDFEIKEVVY